MGKRGEGNPYTARQLQRQGEHIGQFGRITRDDTRRGRATTKTGTQTNQTGQRHHVKSAIQTSLANVQTLAVWM
eukprot:10885065-Lingulodinium_polyedra.AAC.1